MANGLFLSSRILLLRGFSDGRLYLLALCLGLLLFPGCALLQAPSDTAAPAKPASPKSPAAPVQLPQTGEASWYGAQHQGKRTASGATYDRARLTAAHPTLPFGSRIKVTNLANGKSVEVEITDRGPFVENRIIDLSPPAAKALGMIEAGTATVRLELPPGH